MRAKIAIPVDLSKNDPIARMLSQRWLLVTIGILFAGALSASYFSNDYLKIYNIYFNYAIKTYLSYLMSGICRISDLKSILWTG